MPLPNQLELQTLFSGFLFETGLSAVSVKNYLSDLRHFFSFCASISTQDNPPSVQEIFQSISKYINLYLIDQKKAYTPQNTINRRSASIRRFSTFLAVKFGLVSSLQEPNEVSKNTPASHISPKNTVDDSLPTISKILEHFKIFLVKEKKTHSTVKNYISDLNHFFAWSANETPFLDQNLENILSESHLNTYVTYLKLSHTSTSVINRRQSSVKQFSRYCFLQKYIPNNPFEYKRDVPRLLPLSWFERLSGSKNKHISSGPKSRLATIYQKYNSLPFTPYLHLAILVLATSAMVIFGYNQIIKQATPSSAALPTVPKRQLSFQGRLTDSSATPITTSVNVVFKLFNDPTAGTQLYTSGTCSIVPDQNGIFNTLIGGGTCGSEIANTVFTENRDVYLEVGVGAETLTPRQQIATVGYALNSETLQGYPASGSATINTVPIVDNNGDINIAAASPSINSTSGTFNLNGQALTLTTTANSGGDIILQPDAIGGGQVQVLGATTTTDTLRIENANLTSGALISGYIGNNTATGNLLSLTSGSVETDRFLVGANGRTLINTNGGTDSIFSASASGVTKFTIASNGNLLATGTLTGLTGLTVASGTVSLPNGEINNAEISEVDWTKLQNYPSACPAGQAIQAVGDTLTCVDLGAAALWQRTSGSLAPIFLTDALNLGSTATSSAIVSLPGTINSDAFFNLGTGKLGIGTTTPAEKLDVNGAIKLGTTATNNAGTLRYTAQNNLEIYDGTYWATLNTGKYTKDITGFVDRTTTTLSFTNTSPDRTFTITGTNFPVFIKSEQFLKNTESIQISTTIGLHFIYYNASGTLTTDTNAWDLSTDVPIATVYWNGTTGLIGDERHGISMDHATHEYLHKTIGSRYDTGLGGTFTNTTFSIDPGSFYDEDLKHTITPAQTTTRVFYRVPAATSFTYTTPQAAYYTASTGTLDYDNAGTRTAVPISSYVAYWVFATNDPTNPIYTLMGQREDSTLTNARNNNVYQSLSLPSLPSAEMKLLYRVLVRNQGGVATFIEIQDERSITNLPSGTYIATAHGTLTGLLNDDHTQYALLAGRALGQVLIGGSAADETLTLQGNAAAAGNTATSANMIFKTGDSGGTTAMTILNNGNIGMGLTNPGSKLTVVGTMTSSGGNISLNNDSNFTTNINTGTSTGAVTIGGGSNTVAVNSSSWDISTSGAASGFTGIASSGDIDFSSLSAGGLVKAAVTTGRLSIASSGTDYELPLTFSNGLTRSVNAVKLGGTLTANTDIPLGGFNLAFSGTGNVGIGLTNPAYELDVVGDVNITGSYLVNGSPLTASNWQRTLGSLAPLNITDSINLGSTATSSALVHLAGTAAENSFINTGNFGIGLTNPTYDLDVTGDMNLTGALYDNGSAGSPGQLLSTTGTGVQWIDAPTSATNQGWTWSAGVLYPTIISDAVNLGNAATASATVHLAGKAGDNSFINTGNFGVGLTNPTAGKLQVAGGNIIVDSTYGLDTAAAGTLALGDTNSTIINVGTNATARTITLGNVTGATAVNVNTGTAGTTYTTTNGIFTLNTGTGNISLGTDAAAKAIAIGNSTGATSVSLNGGTGNSVNVGTNAIAHTVTIGNITGATAVNVNTGTAGTTYTTTNGIFTLNTGTGNISLGTDAAAKAILIGNSTGATSVSLDGGTGNSVNVGTNAIAHTVTIGNITGATAVNVNTGTAGTTYTTTNGIFTLNTGTGNISLGTDAAAKILTLGNATGATALALNSGTGDIILTSTDQIKLNSSKAAGGTTTEALSFFSTVDLAATDEIFQVGDSAANMLTILGNGNVGIGTDLPSNSLDIGYNGGGIEFTGTGTHTINATAGTLSIGGHTVTGPIDMSNQDISNIYSLTGYLDQDFDIYSLGTGNIRLNPNGGQTGRFEWWGGTGAALVAFTNDGKVGIGLTNPAYSLDVIGDINLTGQLKLASFTDAGRPTPLGAGSLLYSTTQNNPQYYDGANWQNLSNYFSRLTTGTVYPTNWYDSINIGYASGGAGASSSATVRISGDATNSSFFVNPVAFGFRTDSPGTTSYIKQPRAGYTFAIETQGGIIPRYTGTDLLGYENHEWSELHLSDSIVKGGLGVITLNDLSLNTDVWHATAGFKVGTGALSAGVEFEVIGDTNITQTLSVGGQVTVGGGSGKMDVGTVDPPYTINGQKYATYMASMIGVKEETVGKVTTTDSDYIEGVGYRTLIDLDQQPVGSDVWLFSKTTNLNSHINDLAVLLTPEGQAKAWYEVDRPNKILAIYSSTPANISYRLTAPRFDSHNWTNTRTSSSLGFVISSPNNGTNTNNIFTNDPSVINLIARNDSSNTYALNINGVENKEVSTFMNSIIANLRTGAATVISLVADNLTVTTKLVSPIADIDQLKVIDATISGTLYADNIKGQTVDNLNTQINLLDSKYSTASAILADLQAKYGTYASLFGATSSATVANDPLTLSPLAENTPIIPSDLALNSLNVHTLIANDLLANGAIFTKSISSFDTDLFIQPAGDKLVNISNNLLVLYPNGKIVINGDLLVTGKILAQGLTSETATVSGSLAIGSSSISTESANFAELTTKGLIIASGNDPLATVSGQTNSNTTIGEATIAPSTGGISITNTKVTPTTLIYITPTSDTEGRVLYVKSKTEGVGFTVGITGNANNPQISFNYWLVETK